jgi:hypothetical protein
MERTSALIFFLLKSMSAGALLNFDDDPLNFEGGLKENGDLLNELDISYILFILILLYNYCYV